MPLQTVNVHIDAFNIDGKPLSAGIFKARLDRFDVDDATGAVVPTERSVLLDASGSGVFELWPNSLGKYNSHYIFSIAGCRYGPFYIPHETETGEQITDIGFHELDRASHSPRKARDYDAQIAANITAIESNSDRITALESKLPVTPIDPPVTPIDPPVIKPISPPSTPPDAVIDGGSFTEDVNLYIYGGSF